MRILMQVGFAVATVAALAAVVLIVRDWRRTVADHEPGRPIPAGRVAQGAIGFTAAFAAAAVFSRPEGVVLGDVFLCAVLFGALAAVIAHFLDAARGRRAPAAALAVPLLFGVVGGWAGLP